MLFEELEAFSTEPSDPFFPRVPFLLTDCEHNPLGDYMTLAELVRDAKRTLGATKLERWDKKYTLRNCIGDLVGTVQFWGRDPIEWVVRE